MSNLKLRCTYCGAPLEEINSNQEVIKCKYCGTIVDTEKGIEFVKRVREYSLENEAHQLSNYRKVLKDSLSSNDYQDQIDTCNKILYLVPNDFEANLYKKLAERNNDARIYESFISSLLDNYLLSEIEPYLSIMIEKARFYELEYLRNIINNNHLSDIYLDLIENRKNELSEERDLYASIDRDVFICHSSKDKELLNRVVNELEKNQGFTVWYSERNMPKNTTDYWKTIEENIINCKVFLFLITENSKFSPDVKEELTRCKKLNKTKVVALYAMEGDPGIEIKQFLGKTGTQWIDINNKDAFKDLVIRIYELKDKINWYDNSHLEGESKIEYDNMVRKVNEFKSKMRTNLLNYQNELNNFIEKINNLKLNAKLDYNYINEVTFDSYHDVMYFIKNNSKEIEKIYNALDNYNFKDIEFNYTFNNETLNVNNDIYEISDLPNFEIKDIENDKEYTHLIYELYKDCWKQIDAINFCIEVMNSSEFEKNFAEKTKYAFNNIKKK